MDQYPNGGVRMPLNLALYNYTWSNPVNLHDPDGRAVGDSKLKRMLLWIDGAVDGAVQSLIPGGFLLDMFGHSSSDSDYLHGKGSAQGVVGAAQAAIAVTGETGGTGVAATGIGVIPGVATVGVSAAVGVQGGGNAAAGLATLDESRAQAAREQANLSQGGGAGAAPSKRIDEFAKGAG